VEEAARVTFGGMADEFVCRYARPKLRSRTVVEYTRTLKGPRIQSWQDRPMASITRQDVMALLDGIEAEEKHATAKLTLAYLRKFFVWCAERDVVSEVPTHRIRLNGVVKSRERTLSTGELRRVWTAAGKVGGIGGALVKLLMLTGQRRFETSVMRWRDLSGLESTEALWSIPGKVTKNHRPHTVPLAPGKHRSQASANSRSRSTGKSPMMATNR